MIRSDEILSEFHKGQLEFRNFHSRPWLGQLVDVREIVRSGFHIFGCCKFALPFDIDRERGTLRLRTGFIMAVGNVDIDDLMHVADLWLSSRRLTSTTSLRCHCAKLRAERKIVGVDCVLRRFSLKFFEEETKRIFFAMDV